MTIKIKSIEWGEADTPNAIIPYDHTLGDTPMCTFLITWKSWKDSPSYDIEIYEGSWLGSESSLEEAKQLAQTYFEETVLGCIESERATNER